MVKRYFLSYSFKFLFHSEVGKATTEEWGTKNEEEVRDDGAQERVLHHIYFVLDESKQCYYKLCGISTCCIQQPSHCFTKLMKVNY